MKKPRIGLVGFFGWGNFGDELFLLAHRTFLSPACDVSAVNDLTVAPYFSRPIDEVVQEYDGFVIGGGDLIIPWQISQLYFRMEYLRKPVYVVGVGVPTWKEGTDKALKYYRKFFQSPSVKMIIARDRESAKWIRKNIAPSSPVRYFPDLVCALDLPPAAPAPTPTFGLVLRHRKGGEDDLSRVRALCDRARSMGYAIRHIVLGTGDVGKVDSAVANRFRREDEPVILSDDLNTLCEAIGSCHAIASMKFHGTVVATMYGVPSITLSSTDKNRNFLRIIERMDLSSAFSARDLPDRLPRYPAPISSIVRNHLKEEAGRAYEKLRHRIGRQSGQ